MQKQTPKLLKSSFKIAHRNRRALGRRIANDKESVWVSHSRPVGCPQMTWGRTLENALKSKGISKDFETGPEGPELEDFEGF